MFVSHLLRVCYMDNKITYNLAYTNIQIIKFKLKFIKIYDFVCKTF
jgi:hypothetical protein